MAEKVTLGNINGRSAYQVAVDEGFSGTEAEWLASLKGDVTPEAEAARDEAVTAAGEASSASLAAGAHAAAVQAVVATNDGIMTSVAQDPESQFANQLSTTIGEYGYSRAEADVEFARPLKSSRTIIIGDSIDAGTPTGWYHYYALGLGRIQQIRNAGIGGQTTTQMRARLQSDVLDYSPDVVILGGFTNDTDPGNGVSAQTTRENIAAMVAAVRSAGAIPVLRTAPPISVGGDARTQLTMSQNTWMKQFGIDQGIDVLDIFQSVADPATGQYATGISSDNVHPTEVGAKAIADYLLELPTPSAFRGNHQFARAVTDESNMVANGVFVGDSDSNGLANSWVAQGTATYSISDAETGISGNWQRVTTASATAGSFRTSTINPTSGSRTVWAVGDRISVCGRIRTSDTGSALVRLTFVGAGSTTDVVRPLTLEIDGVFSGEFTIPAGTTGIQLMVQNSVAAGWVEVAEVAIRNLTQLDALMP